jgi:hypothetical protein
VPRAKKTDRSAARRRHRAVTGTVDDHVPENDAEGAPETRSTPARPARPSITAAFRAAFHPLDWRDDLLTFRSVAFGSKAVWLPLVVSAFAAGLFVFDQSSITFLIFQYFVFTMPLGAVFLAGFLAPRSSWLAGLVVGFGTVLIFAISLSTGRLNEVYAAETHGAYIGQSLLLSTVGGAFFAATAAWYRRFLRLSNPNRMRQEAQAKKHGRDGRSRTSRPHGSSTRR